MTHTNRFEHSIRLLIQEKRFSFPLIHFFKERMKFTQKKISYFYNQVIKYSRIKNGKFLKFQFGIRVKYMIEHQKLVNIITRNMNNDIFF